MDRDIEIEFAVIGYTDIRDIEKSPTEEKDGRQGLLSWHPSAIDAWTACTEINTNGGFASVQRLPGGEMTSNAIVAILECI